MQKIINSTFVKEFVDLIDNMYRLGWHERNSGNISYQLMEEDLKPYINELKVKETIDLNECYENIRNNYYLVTESGKHFRNVKNAPESNIGIIKINHDGTKADIMWGFGVNGRPTSELPTHLKIHSVRKSIDEKQRVVIHSHATNLVAMSFVHELNDKAFTLSLWQMATESIVVFPEGVGVLPWMVCGNANIASQTAEKMKKYRAVIWALHGIFACGVDLDDAFGLIETMEKAAKTYMLTLTAKRKQIITTEQLKALARAFNIEPKLEFLE